MDNLLEEYLNPLPYQLYTDVKEGTLGHVIQPYIDEFPEWTSADIALIGVPEGRYANGNAKTSTAPDQVRKELLRLSNHFSSLQLVDLGNIKMGEIPEVTQGHLINVLVNLMQEDVIPVLIGGSIDLGYGMYKAHTLHNQNIEVSAVLPRVYLEEDEVIHRICMDEPNHLFNLNLLGFQSHYADPEDVHVLEKMFFEPYRLGVLKSRLKDAEPILRNTDILLFDIGAVKQADAPGNYNNNPSGFSSEEACQLAWFTGVGEKTAAMGLFEINPEFDYRNTTSKLGAQIIWYFLDGVHSRTGDHPKLHKEFVKYRCTLNDRHPDIIFHKSKRTDRWWMEIPNIHNPANKQTLKIPCTYGDYQQATRGEMPDRFFKALQRMPK